MTLTPGQRLGPYEVTAKLGEGGMGEVYRASDTRLKRQVAIKVLPPAFTEDRERLARFEREAQLLAQLHHPNIASIFGLEESGGVRALVMELVEGDDLSALIANGPLPVMDALAIARQIAAALETAHEQGIVHRDLKPQNVKISRDGTVKVLDFGLAKAMAPPGSASVADLANSPTLMSSPTLTGMHGTQLGVILGSAAYMAPEQAKGMAVDKRADIWAFGVVFYEMLTGSSLFAGDSVGDTLAAVIRAEIDLGRLPAEMPGAIRQLLRRCLERNPKNRLHDIADARIVLDEVIGGQIDEGAIPRATPPRSSLSRALPWIAGFALGAALATLAARTLLAPPPMAPPSLVSLTYSGKDALPAASPDGKTVAFNSTRDGKSRIWLKQLATGEEVALTAGPADTLPSFSPDGSSLLFMRGATVPYELFSVPAVGGEPRRIADHALSATWAPDGQRIALTRASTPGGLPDTVVTVSAEGGDELELARTEDVLLFSLRWSPDGSAIGAWAQLRTNFAAQQSIVEFDAASGVRRTIYQPGGGTLVNTWGWSGARDILVGEATTQSGRGGSRLLRIGRRGGPPVALLSLQKPSLALDVVGAGRVVIDQVSQTQNLGVWPLSAEPRPASQSAPPGSGVPDRWLTRGASVDRQPVFSADGQRLLFNSDRGGNLDLWQMAIDTGSVRRVTVAASEDWDPAYTRDGESILWSSNRSGNYEIWSAASDGGGARKLTADGVDAENPTATPDGRWIVYASGNPAQSGIWKIGSDGTGVQRVVAGTLTVPELSPDGRWVSFIDSDTFRLRVAALDGGAEIASIQLPSPGFQNVPQVGRSRWLSNSAGPPTLLWVDYDLEAGATRIVAQEIAPGRDTRATRRTLVQGTPDDAVESFAVSPDGKHLVVSVGQFRSDLLLIEGLPGVTR